MRVCVYLGRKITSLNILNNSTPKVGIFNELNTNKKSEFDKC